MGGVEKKETRVRKSKKGWGVQSYYIVLKREYFLGGLYKSKNPTTFSFVVFLTQKNFLSLGKFFFSYISFNI